MFADYIFATRPLLMLPVWSIYLVSRFYYTGSTGAALSPTDLLLLGALTFVAAGSYYLNQITDFASDALNLKLGFLQKRLVSERGLMLGFLLLSVGGMILALLVSWWQLFVLAQLFLLGYVYSMPPVRAKDSPLGGFLANAYGYGVLIPLMALPTLEPTRLQPASFVLSLYFFCTVGGIYLLTTLPDRHGDTLTGKRTAGVLLPRRLVLVLALILLIASSWLMWKALYTGLMYISLLASIPVILSLAIESRSIILLAAKLPILLLTLLACYFCWWYLMFLVAVVVFTRLYYSHRFGITYPRLT